MRKIIALFKRRRELRGMSKDEVAASLRVERHYTMVGDITPIHAPQSTADN